jgi:hypothetical protein
MVVVGSGAIGSELLILHAMGNQSNPGGIPSHIVPLEDEENIQDSRKIVQKMPDWKFLPARLLNPLIQQVLYAGKNQKS